MSENGEEENEKEKIWAWYKMKGCCNETINYNKFFIAKIEEKEVWSKKI